MRLALLRVLPLAFSAANAMAMDVQCGNRSSHAASHIIELYTSEGCSSCPPAERWLETLRAADPDVAALAFHVDYWDSLGWRDRYSDARYMARQQQLAAGRSSSIVYTPEVVIDAREIRDWSRFGGPLRETVDAPLALEFEIEPSDPPRARLIARAGRSVDAYRWHLVVTQNGLTSAIGAGENAGTTMRHPDVVRSFSEAMRIGDGEVVVPLPDGGSDSVETDVVALVVDAERERAVQAIKLPWPG